MKGRPRMGAGVARTPRLEELGGQPIRHDVKIRPNVPSVSHWAYFVCLLRKKAALILDLALILNAAQLFSTIR